MLINISSLFSVGSRVYPLRPGMLVPSVRRRQIPLRISARKKHRNPDTESAVFLNMFCRYQSRILQHLFAGAALFLIIKYTPFVTFRQAYVLLETRSAVVPQHPFFLLLIPYNGRLVARLAVPCPGFGRNNRIAF